MKTMVRTKTTDEKQMNGFSHGKTDVEMEPSKPGYVIHGQDSTKGYLSSLLLKLKSDKDYREKYITSISLLWSFVILGWILSQTGPSFLDLQIITNTGLDEGSTFFTASAIGYLLGSLITGIMYDKLPLDKSLVVFSSIIGSSIVLLLLPWCYQYELMLFAHVMKGIFTGGLDTSGNAHLMYIWEGQCRKFMQALHFSFAFGGILAPYAMTPFLAEESVPRPTHTASTQNFTEEYINISSYADRNNSFPEILPAYSSPGTNINNTTMNIPIEHPEESLLYIAYTTTAALSLSTALPFIFLLVQTRCRKETKKRNETSEEKEMPRRLSKSRKVAAMIIVCAFMGIYCAIEDSFNSFLAAFCVKGMKWSKAEAATVTSVYWVSLAVGRFFGIFLVKKLRPSYTICSFSISFSICHLGFFLSAFFKFDVGIWICSAGAGMTSSVIFPTLFTWTNEEIVQVTGKIASLFMITASGGAVLNPIALGILMDNFSPMWFTYILFGETIIQVLLFFLAILVVNKKTVPDSLSLENEGKAYENRGFWYDNSDGNILSVRL